MVNKIRSRRQSKLG